MRRGILFERGWDVGGWEVRGNRGDMRKERETGGIKIYRKTPDDIRASKTQVHFYHL